ncbi:MULTISPECIES: hypothetical protein [Capnocytophaga]|jgi:hypothetical protein|uniref:hypothetical protein n=1 Tax=Capnocytophaga TaxID=1016 RepID=UPI00034E981F|nr:MULTISPECIES: hypothetical protein [Capnocytophaga]EPE01004.1 hypothetical protein HMPREF1528_00697 [Capnocytophaga sp. oral taxon 336 str. F0502]MDU6658765.1 hypothetical protein [Capnocytophaga sp.]
MAVEFGKWQEIKRNPTIPFTQEKGVLIKGWWSADKEGKNVITNASLEDTVYFHIEMMGASIQDGDKLSLQLYEYDTFIWVDSFNLDDKIENPKECIIKDGKALLEVFLKPDWNKYIEEDTGYEIELYWKVKYSKKDITINLPDKSENYLNVKNDRNIFIKPVMAENGYNYGIPEIYDYNGDLLMFSYIDKVELIKEDYQEENYLKSFLISGGAYWADKKLPSISEKIAIAKINSGYRVNQAGKVIKYDYWEQFLESKRTLRQSIPFERRKAKGIDQVAIMKTKNWMTQKLYFIKNAANMFSNFYSLEELARGKGDMNSVLSDALVLATNSTPILGILTKMTLDVLATPMSMFIEEGRNIDKKKIDKVKFKGLLEFEKELNKSTFLKNIYKTHNISYETMQGIISKTIKKQENMKSANNEVTIVYKEVKNGILIDCFFVNIKE